MHWGSLLPLSFLHGVAEHSLGFGRRKFREGLDPHFFRLCHARNKNRLGMSFRGTALRGASACVAGIGMRERPQRAISKAIRTNLDERAIGFQS